MIIKIQSISDLITNSSTEVYITYYGCDKTAIINVVNAILSVNGEGKFEDYFEFEWIPNEDRLYDLWEDNKIDIPFDDWVKTLTEDDLFETYSHGYYDEERNYVEGYKIIAKDSKNTHAANLLTGLDSIFTYDVSYDG